MKGYKRRHAGIGDNYPKRQCRQVQCHLCNKDLLTGSLQFHLSTVHYMDGCGLILVVEQADPVPGTYIQTRIC